MRFIRSLSLVTLLCCMAGVSHAQETGTGTTTERTSDDVLATMEEWGADRLSANRTTLLSDDKAYKILQSETARLRSRQAEQRRQCREDIRRANRDSITRVTGDCYRNELIQEMAILREERAYIMTIPLIDSDIRSSALQAVDNMLEAEEAIIDGIDTGLFSSKEGLLLAKKNLHTHYRMPYRSALLRVRADRQLTWIIYVVKTIFEQAVQQSVTDEEFALIWDAALCLEEAGASFDAARTASDPAVIAGELRAGREKALLCRAILRELAE